MGKVGSLVSSSHPLPQVIHQGHLWDPHAGAEVRMNQVVRPNRAVTVVSEVLLCLRSLDRLLIVRLLQFLEMEYYYESLNLPMMNYNMTTNCDINFIFQ